MMDYTKKHNDYEKLKSELEKVLEDYETQHGQTDFVTQEGLATQGDEDAQFLLGVMYVLGVWGITQNFIFAHVWFNRSSARGRKDGGYFRDEVFKQISVTQQKEAQNMA